ncbi:Biopolymer transport protein ExbB OS=Castellaniella defragrans OX=75697 GN=HNR28_000772 PE=3 SV=1 [Castellaniella defragrans]
MFDIVSSAVLALAQAVGPETSAAAGAVASGAGAAAGLAAAVPAPEAVSGLGILHFLGQSDLIGKSLFVFLLLMSVASWYLILVKGLTHLRIRHRSKKFLYEFWAASSLEQVENEIATHGATEPFAHLASHAIHAQKHHARYGALKLEESGSTASFVTRTIRKVIDEETAHLENGLTVLASVGSTAPFVGLFGTVWGVYHALLSIGMADGVTINRIAGPVGEALVMTGLGLAVAIPAVLGYNAFVRINRVYLATLDAFAHDLFTFLTTGQPVDDVDHHERRGSTISLAARRGA